MTGSCGHQHITPRLMSWCHTPILDFKKLPYSDSYLVSYDSYPCLHNKSILPRSRLSKLKQARTRDNLTLHSQTSKCNCCMAVANFNRFLFIPHPRHSYGYLARLQCVYLVILEKCTCIAISFYTLIISSVHFRYTFHIGIWRNFAQR